MAKIADKVFELIEETVNAQGVELWDVRFVKEGVSHYLRVFIDKPGGVDINDCTNVSHAIDPIIDEADPIDVSYYLEVSSPGLNRELNREKHFKAMLNKPIIVKLYKAFEGQKQISGKLIDYDDGPTVLLDDGRTVKFTAADISKAILNEDF